MNGFMHFFTRSKATSALQNLFFSGSGWLTVTLKSHKHTHTVTYTEAKQGSSRSQQEGNVSTMSGC